MEGGAQHDGEEEERGLLSTQFSVPLLKGSMARLLGATDTWQGASGDLQGGLTWMGVAKKITASWKPSCSEPSRLQVGLGLSLGSNMRVGQSEERGLPPPTLSGCSGGHSCHVRGSTYSLGQKSSPRHGLADRLGPIFLVLLSIWLSPSPTVHP